MRALVLRGGGFRGAVQVPVLHHLHSLYEYDAIFGVSVGALNGAMFAMDELDGLQSFWDNIDGIDGFLKLKWWPFSGFYSMAPLRKKIRDRARLKKIKTPFYAGLVSLLDGRYYNYGSSEMSSDEQLWGAIEASACIVGMMEPPVIDLYGEKQLAGDGGFRSINLVTRSGIFSQVDVVACSPLSRTSHTGPHRIEVVESKSFYRDYKYIFGGLPEGGRVTIYAPQRSVGPTFRAPRELVQRRFELGYEAIENPIILEK